MKQTTALLLALAAVAALPGCVTFTVDYDIPDPTGGKAPVGHIGISHTWTPKPALPTNPGSGKTPALFAK